MPHPWCPLDPQGPQGTRSRVLILGRISTIHQDIENIQASYRYVEDYLDQIYQGTVHIKHLGERGSGMRTDRATIVEAETLIETGTWDLVIMEDLSRAHRNPRHQYVFVQDAVDADTRVISIGDNLDTADEQWEIALGTAALRHGLAIPDTRRRVRRTAQHAFHRGQMVLKYRFGYRKLSREEADSGRFGPEGLRIARVPEATPTILEMVRRVRDGSTYTAVARWLNEGEIAPGPYSTNGKWTGRLVQDLLRDPILHGTRTFANVKSQPLFRTGKAVRRKNSDGPETEHYPGLAHLSEQEHAELLQVMDQGAARHPRAAGPDHPLYNRPRSRTIWPGQHPRCAICDARMYRFGADKLKCRNAFIPGAVPCWNHVQVNCPILRDKVIALVMGHCDRVPEFRRALADAAWAELEAKRQSQALAAGTLDEEIAELEKRAANLAMAIARGGQLEALVKQLSEVDRNLKDARRRRSDPAQSEPVGPPLGSRGDLDRHLGAALPELARTSFAFGELMRRILPEFHILPVQALDCGQVRPRARFVLRLSGLLDRPHPAGDPGGQAGDVTGTLDMFEPPVHIRAIPACVAARQTDPKLSLDKIAAQTGYNRMIVKRALAYARLMAAEGLSEPYRELTECPTSAPRWRRRDASRGRETRARVILSVQEGTPGPRCAARAALLFSPGTSEYGVTANQEHGPVPDSMGLLLAVLVTAADVDDAKAQAAAELFAGLGGPADG